MKKLLILMSVLILSGCAEKHEFEQTVAEQMQQDKDIKDYKIEPDEMTKCVVETTTGNMPGLFLVDPARRTAYKNYTKMLKLNASEDPKKRWKN